MNKYMLAFRVPEKVTYLLGELTPEQIEESVGLWHSWIGKLMATGNVAGTEQLEDTGVVIRGSDHTIKEGPYIELKELLGGFLILKAASLEEATEIAKGCPALIYEGSVEVRPLVKWPN